MKNHGIGSLDRIVLAGATAARDAQMNGVVALARAEEGRRGRLRAVSPVRPRWPQEFGVLLDRVERAARRDADASAEEIATAVHAVLREQLEGIFGARQPARQWRALLGWTGRSWASASKLSAHALLPWLCCKIDKALAMRTNNFGRILPPTSHDLPEEAELAALAATMNEGDQPPTTKGMPVGLVFLGQFIDHDITLDAITALSDAEVEVDEIINQRSPSLDLDNVYGHGPEASPHLYDAEGATGTLLVARHGNDLPRNEQGRALLGDPRNDENTFVSQLHLQFLLFHNALLRAIGAGGVDAAWGRHADEDDFEFARRMARWHYQWIVVNEYLPQIVSSAPLAAAHAIAGVRKGVASPPALAAEYRPAGRRLRRGGGFDCCGRRRAGPKMPVEFSGAAFRFAHSQVPGRLDINGGALDVPLFTPRPPAPGAFQPVAVRVDWSRFFSIDGSTPQAARAIDTKLSAQLFALPFAPEAPSLPLRNLVRSARVYALPTAEEAMASLSLSSQMTPGAAASVAAAGLEGRTPLWFFCLGEAEYYGGRLGPVGGLIVAWTLLHMLHCDERSYVHVEPAWAPVLPSKVSGEFRMEDLLKLAAAERAALAQH